MKDRFQFHSSCGEDQLQAAIRISREALLAGEAERTLSHTEFLYQQSRYIQKHWWLIQGCLLLFLGLVLHASESDLFIRRILGVAAPMFAVLLLPELWKNRNCGAMEIEGTAFYTIRQVYAARITLFALVDLLLLSVFFLGTSLLTRITVWELLIQFLLPCNVTCCICFLCLYSRYAGAGALSLLLCSVWTGLWSLLVLRDAVYHVISVPVWCGMLTLSVMLLGFCIRRGQKTIYKTWEAKPSWN